jgi:cobalt-zinc-cadmium efflux system outer membrane protein
VFSLFFAVALRLAPSDAAADALVSEALNNAPEVRVAAADVAAARARIAPARTLPDPMLALQTRRDEGAGLMLSQAIPWPGKLRLAGEAARSEASEIELAAPSRAARTIEARVRNAWYDLVLARATDALIEQRRASTAQIEATVRARYAAGLSVQQDVLRAQIELARIDELKAAQQATIAARVAEINRLLGRPQDAPVDSPAALPREEAAPDAGTVVGAVVAASPEVAAARQSIETGRLGVAVARKNFLPDLVVSGGGPMREASVGVSVPLWLGRKQRNQLAEAEARLAARTAESDVLPRELEALTRERFAQLEASNRTAALYRDKILPLDDLSLESALASYQAGKVPFLTVLDALNVQYSDRGTYNALLAQSAKWRVAIDEASMR